MLTADPGLTADADAVFLQLASQTRAKPPRHLLTAPFVLHRRMLRHVARWPRPRAQGQPARIVVKVNALTDPALIQPWCGRPGRRAHRPHRARRLHAAAGPARPHTDNIRVRSVVGRFLEHSRICTSAGGRATTTRCCTSAAPTG
jgi:polyphosphate kinase